MKEKGGFLNPGSLSIEQLARRSAETDFAFRIGAATLPRRVSMLRYGLLIMNERHGSGLGGRGRLNRSTFSIAFDLAEAELANGQHVCGHLKHYGVRTAASGSGRPDPQGTSRRVPGTRRHDPRTRED